MCRWVGRERGRQRKCERQTKRWIKKQKGSEIDRDSEEKARCFNSDAAADRK